MKNIDIEKRIIEIPLTKTDKVIADYIVEHQDTVGLTTVANMARDIGVSDTSIIRLLRNIGYEGFADFKRDMADRMVQAYKENRDNLSVGEKYLKNRDALNKNDIITEVVEKTITNIRDTFETTDPELLKTAAECLMKAKHRYIVGFRGASSCANYMARKMALLIPRVDAFDRAESIALEHIVDITKEDCLLMYSFPRYSEINTTILKKAKENGAKTILITDKITSPLAVDADYVLTAAVQGAGITVSYVVPLCISEALLLYISKNLSPKDKKRLSELDDLVSRTRQY